MAHLLRKTYSNWIGFCCFASKIKLINLLSFSINLNIKAMNFKKRGDLLVKIVLFMSYYLLTKTDKFDHKDLKTYLVWE